MKVKHVAVLRQASAFSSTNKSRVVLEPNKVNSMDPPGRCKNELEVHKIRDRLLLEKRKRKRKK